MQSIHLFIKYENNGKHFCSGSKDGTVKLWDGSNNRCISTLDKAHSGEEVCSVVFSRNGKYILSSGKVLISVSYLNIQHTSTFSQDSTVRLWELSTNRCLMTYSLPASEKYKGQAMFDLTEDRVMINGEDSLHCWDSRNGTYVKLLNLGHEGPVSWMRHSPTHKVFLSCADDYRAKVWNYI